MIAVVISVTFCILLTQPKIYATVSDVIKTATSGGFDKYTYRGELSEETFDEYKRLGYVPEGYDIRSIVFGGCAAVLNYENENEDTIEFMYGIASNSSISIDNERHTYKEIKHNGQTYYLYIATEENDWSTIIWYRGDYVYSVNAHFDENELVKIAESVEF